VVTVSRRSFLLGSASALALAACGGGRHSESASDQTSSTETTAGGLAVAKVFSPTQPAGVPLRLPLALADSEGAILDDVPTSIRVRYGLADSKTLSDALDLRRHDQGIPHAYFPLVATFPTPGTWRIRVEANGSQADTSLSVVDAGEVPAVPDIGQALIPMRTPTKDDSRGVDPICTRDPVCPFHDLTLEEAMKTGNAVAFLVSTPAFCQTAICGPVLDLLIARSKDLSQTMSFVHAEVYTDSTAKTTTEAVQTYGLTYEPALFVATPDGTIASRLDYTFDAVELDDALSRVVQ
jgi:hypothetical protein